MEKSGYAESFRDLLAYQKARELARDEAQQLLNKCARVGRLLGDMMAKSHLFCSQPNILRESQPDYFTNDNPFTDNG
jgi:hypothetical protein